jgi:hypothetical protein
MHGSHQKKYEVLHLVALQEIETEVGWSSDIRQLVINGARI